jgi:hypothetical protein
MSAPEQGALKAMVQPWPQPFGVGAGPTDDQEIVGARGEGDDLVRRAAHAAPLMRQLRRLSARPERRLQGVGGNLTISGRKHLQPGEIGAVAAGQDHGDVHHSVGVGRRIETGKDASDGHDRPSVAAA